MTEVDNTSAAEISSAFDKEELQVRLQNYRVACILALVFMPAGVLLDLLVYPTLWPDFLKLRLLCSFLLLFIWWLVKTPLGVKHYRLLGMILPALPSFFISWMICVTQGPVSPYYAGLNLVLLGAALVLRWSLLDSVLVFAEVTLMYLVACGVHILRQKEISFDSGIFFNNVYFLSVTGVFGVIGSHFYNRLRFREFALRFELDQNRRTLESNNQKLVELDQIKSRFFANISHELRTPLTLLLAPLETMLYRSASVDEEARAHLVAMRANGMRLLKLINDLLDLVRLESGRMEVKKDCVDVDEFVRGLASAARQVAEDKRLALEALVDPKLGTITADRDKLEKIILNLLFNALKFTSSGGRVVLRAEKQGDSCVITVADTGMGISEKQLPFVFDRFWQADGSSKRKYQGVGIGLALVKELTEIQGGTVSVESQPGKGSTFTIRLPYVPGTAPLSSEMPPVETPRPDPGNGTVSSEEWLANLYRRAELFPALPPVQGSLKPAETWANENRPRLLVADDEPDMLRFLKSQLVRQYQVLEAVDGQQAVEKAAQFLPDIILLDMMMPEKDGLQACRELRERTSTQSIPIVLLTARADEETKLAALSAGASDFLAKPFSTTELHVRIKNLVEAYDYQRKLAKQNQVLEHTIEQLKETETQLVQSEKMASLGRLSAGIIHEINNPLNFATTGLFTLRNKNKFLQEDQRSEYAEVLGDVEEGISRVKDIVSSLRSFSYQENEQREEVVLSDAVHAALKFLSHEWKGEVQVQEQVPAELLILSSRNKLIQVLLNLLQNSLDALAEKSFSTERPTIWIEGKLTGESVFLTVRDNGVGIDPKNMDKIFDPFFTTKDVGKGMGLGLSICYRIIEEFDGRIEVKSEPGQFCEFSLEFPAVQVSAAAVAVSA